MKRYLTLTAVAQECRRLYWPVYYYMFFYRTRRMDVSRRMAAMRRRRETVKKDALTMYDLIFYNPTGNPIV